MVILIEIDDKASQRITLNYNDDLTHIKNEVMEALESLLVDYYNIIQD